MIATTLKKIIKLHELWLSDSDTGQRVDLSDADLSRANLSGADLSGADLSGADLFGANLSDANLDFSQLNLSCKGLNFTICKRLKKQILYHAINLCGAQYFKKSTIKWVNTSHLVTEHNLPEL